MFFTNSAYIAVVTLLSGVFIDLDHWFDYFVHAGKIKIDVKDFFDKCNNTEFNRYFLFLHSYEFIVVLLIMAFVCKTAILIGLSLGFGSHMLVDTLNWPKGAICYSLIYRIAVRFEGEKIFPKRHDDSDEKI